MFNYTRLRGRCDLTILVCLVFGGHRIAMARERASLEKKSFDAQSESERTCNAPIMPRPRFVKISRGAGGVSTVWVETRDSRPSAKIENAVTAADSKRKAARNERRLYARGRCLGVRSEPRWLLGEMGAVLERDD